MDLVAIYVDALGRDVVVVDRKALADELTELCHRAGEAAPCLHQCLPDFVRHLAALAIGGTPPPREHVADLAIAFAASRGDPQAMRALEAMLIDSVARAVKRIDPTDAFADLVRQDLRTHLFVGDRPRIVHYAGRGPLGGWLRTAAARIALNLRRGVAQRPHEVLSSKILAFTSEPDVAIVRVRYREAFEQALRVGLAALPSRERAALCMSVRDGMTSEQLATLYRVSRATAKRLLARARESLLEETRRELRDKLGLTLSEFHSVARVVCEDIDVSLVRLLESGEVVSS